MKPLFTLVLLTLSVACAAGPSLGESETPEPTVEIYVDNVSGGPVALYLQGIRAATVEPGKHCVTLKLPSRGTTHYRLGVKHLAEKIVYSDFATNFGEIRFWQMTLRHISMLPFDFTSLRPSPACAERSGASRDYRLRLGNAGY